MKQVNEMMQQDAKVFVAVQGGIIASAGVFVVAPEAIVPAAKIIKNNSKEIGRQALCVMALTCHRQSGPEDIKKYRPTMTMIRHEKTVKDMTRRIKIEEASQQKSSLQLPSPPSPPSPPLPPPAPPPPPPPMN